MIFLVFKEGGGSTNPKLNALLARVIDDGKAKDVSSATMMEALKRLVCITFCMDTCLVQPILLYKALVISLKILILNKTLQEK